MRNRLQLQVLLWIKDVMENLTWNSSPCFSLQYSFIFGYTHSIRVFLSINMSVKVELVKMRTTLELSGGRFSRHPEKILSTASSSLGAMSCHVMSCHVMSCRSEQTEQPGHQTDSDCPNYPSFWGRHSGYKILVENLANYRYNIRETFTDTHR